MVNTNFYQKKVVCRRNKFWMNRRISILSEDIYDSNKSIPIASINLDTLKKRKLWENSIVLCNIDINPSHTQVQYASKPKYEGMNVRKLNLVDEFDIDDIEGNIVLLLLEKSDLLKSTSLCSQFFFVSISDNIIGSSQQDKYILLTIIHKMAESADVPNECKWDYEFVDKLKRLMRISVRGVPGKIRKHHGSLGDYHGVGSVAKYAVDNTGMSVGTFSTKIPSKNTKLFFNQLEEVLKLIKQDIVFTANRLDYILPGLVNSGLSILSAVSQKKSQLKPHLDNTHNFSFGDPSGSLSNTNFSTGYFCDKATTDIIHNEKDCSYTIISVPFVKDTVKLSNQYYFEFWHNINSKEHGCYKVKLIPGLSLYYSSFLLMHRQVSHLSLAERIKQPFWNINSYVNNRFFNNLQKSMNR